MVSQDKQYLGELAKKFPHLATFISCLPGRFTNATKQTKCEGDKCGMKLRINQFHIFISPGPMYRPMVLCTKCLKLYYERYGDSGQYDNHLWITGKFAKN